MQGNTYKKDGKRKRSAPQKTAKPATPITAFFKPVPPTTTVIIPITVPTLLHLYHLFTPTNLTCEHGPPQD